MKRLIGLTLIAAMAASLAACDTPNGQAAGTGALLGGATGALIGAAVTGRPGGALIGGATGAAAGAVIGSASANASDNARYAPPPPPPRQCARWYYDYYGHRVCSEWY